MRLDLNYIYISTDTDLDCYIKDFLGKKSFVMALDMEAELHRHIYGERLCLVQIYDGKQVIIVDPLSINEKTLIKFFENKDILKVMYDASSDFTLLKRIFGIEIKSILDLKPAVDLLNYEKRNLYSVIAQELGIHLTDKHKFQRHNWMTRPIDKDALDYAISDVLYLLPLKDILMKKISEKKLIDRFILKNLQVQNIELASDPEKKYKSINGYSSLNSEEKVIFQKIYDIRKEYAEMYNLPAYRIIRNEDLILAARDTKYLNRIQFPINLSVSGIQQLFNELKAAIHT